MFLIIAKNKKNFKTIDMIYLVGQLIGWLIRT